MMRWRLFFYSPNNLFGLMLACLGPVLLLAGVVGIGWLVISLLAYATGWSAAALFFAQSSVEQEVELTLDDVQSFLEKLVRERGKQLPNEAVVRLRSISTSLDQAMPRFREMASATGSAGKEWLVFRQVILNYLPQTLGNYLRLPSAYAAMHKVGNTGKTPNVLLIEQLAIMDTELRLTATSLFESDANQMLVNSKFLDNRFGEAIDFLA